MYSEFKQEDTHTKFWHSTKIDMHCNDLSNLEKWEIEYLAINMPMLLLKRPRQFIELVKLASDRDISILNLDSVKHVVEFKWQKYTQRFFFKQLVIAIMFLFWFIADIVNG